MKRKANRIAVGLVITILLMASSLSSASTKGSLREEDLLLHNYVACLRRAAKSQVLRRMCGSSYSKVLTR